MKKIILISSVLSLCLFSHAQIYNYANGQNVKNSIIQNLPDFTGKFDEFTSSAELEEAAREINTAIKNLSSKTFSVHSTSNWEGLNFYYNSQGEYLQWSVFGEATYKETLKRSVGYDDNPKYSLRNNKRLGTGSLRISGLTGSDFREIKNNSSLKFSFDFHLVPINVTKVQKFRTPLSIPIIIDRVYWKDGSGRIRYESSDVSPI